MEFIIVMKNEIYSIAVIHRINDDDDKLIIVPENKTYSNDAINTLVEF